MLPSTLERTTHLNRHRRQVDSILGRAEADAVDGLLLEDDEPDLDR